MRASNMGAVEQRLRMGSDYCLNGINTGRVFAGSIIPSIVVAHRINLFIRTSQGFSTHDGQLIFR